MIEKYYEGVIPSESQDGTRMTFDQFDWPSKCDDAVSTWTSDMESFSIGHAIEAAMCLIRDVDLFINDTAPFKLAKDETKQAELGAILYQCLETLRIASILLSSIIPDKMDEFHKAIGVPNDTSMNWGGLKVGTTIKKVALFPRIDQ